jgi:hypothetical protein
MILTIKCVGCSYTTDVDSVSSTNPNHCPQCLGSLVEEGTGTPFPSDPGVCDNCGSEVDEEGRCEGCADEREGS